MCYYYFYCCGILWVINSLILSRRWCALGSVVRLICVFCVCILEVGSTAFKAWSWILFGFDFIGCWCFWVIEFNSAIAFDSFIAHTKYTYSLTSIVHYSVLQHFPLVFWSSDHTPQCNGLKPPLKSETCLECGGIFNNSSLAWCRYILSSSFGPCCKLAKAWVAWLSNGTKEYLLEISLLSSLHLMFGDPSLTLLAEVRGDFIIFENAIPKMSWPEICAAFFKWCYAGFKFVFIAIKGFYWRYCCLDDVWSTITVISRLTSLTTYFTCSRWDVPWPFKDMLGLCK